MKVKTIYISGPMTGLPKHNYPAFNKAAKTLRKAGYKVYNPAELDGTTTKRLMTWEDCLRRDLRFVVKCHGVALLPGWKDSKGANLEVHVAKELNMAVYPVSYFIENKKEFLRR